MMTPTRRWFQQQAEMELPRAEKALAEGKARLDDLAARIIEYKRQGLRARHAEQLLSVMQQTHHLQARHVETLRREVKEGI